MPDFPAKFWQISYSETYVMRVNFVIIQTSEFVVWQLEMYWIQHTVMLILPFYLSLQGYPYTLEQFYQAILFYIYVFFVRARVCWPFLCFCRPFCIFGTRTQRAAVGSRRATNLATHLPPTYHPSP